MLRLNPRHLKRRPVVILADRDKEEMDAELRSALRGFLLEWHTRSGSPHSIIDLRRVAAGQAKTVILLNPEGDEVHSIAFTDKAMHPTPAPCNYSCP